MHFWHILSTTHLVFAIIEKDLVETIDEMQEADLTSSLPTANVTGSFVSHVYVMLLFLPKGADCTTHGDYLRHHRDAERIRR